jgi:hypothetical protein
MKTADKRRDSFYKKISSKAKEENIKFEEINFIAKMTKDNQKLDIENKMVENEERRRAYL